jgi:ribose transport system permease protein
MNRFGRLFGPMALAIALAVVVFLVGAVTIDGFSSLFSIRSMLVLAAFLGIAAAGQTLVVLIGGIDLSIPFVIGLGNVVAAELTGRHFGLWATLPIVLVIGAAIGAFSGAISSWLNVHPLIVTLGVGTAVQGGVLLWTKGFPSGSAPAGITSFVSVGTHTGPLPVPPLLVFWVVIAALVVICLRWTVFGRKLYALGASPNAAKLALVRPLRLWAMTFAASGALSAAAGVLLLGFTGSASGSVGDQYLFLSVAAVVVGGTSLLGGSGGYLGTFVGALLLTELTTVMVGLGLDSNAEQVVLGAVIVLLVSLYGRQPHVRTQI